MNFSKRHEVRNDPARLAAVSSTELVGAAPEERFDRLTRLAAEALNVPVTFLSLVDRDFDYYLSASGLPEPLATGRRLSGETFCHFTLVSDGVLAIEDARLHPLLSKVPTVQSLGVVAYIGVPLLSSDDQPIGAFCAVDVKPRKWSEADIDSIIAIARVSLGEIHTRRAVSFARTSEEIYDSLAPIVYALFLRILGTPQRASELLFTFMREVVTRAELKAAPPRDARAQALILREARLAALKVRNEPIASLVPSGNDERLADSLTDTERRILSLAYFDGLTIERIAEIVEAPPRAIRQQLIAAMNKVRKAKTASSAAFALLR